MADQDPDLRYCRAVAGLAHESPEAALEHYQSLNEHYRRWWANLVAELKTPLPQTRGNWVLTGSRAFGLAYPESDIEGAVPCSAEEQEQFQDAIGAFFHGIGLTSTAVSTRAGLRMLVLRDVHRDDHVDVWRLESTLRTQELHATISRHIDHHLAGWTPAPKVTYREEQRADFVAKAQDPAAAQRYDERKAWLRVLPASEG